ncbi:MAG: hypothetical protein AB8B96_17290 [Lysobacterales bacterium]
MLEKTQRFDPQGWILIVILTALSLTLGACGSRPPKLEPPRVKLVSLAVQDQSRFTLDLRLSNPAARQIHIDRIELSVTINGAEIPALSPEFSGLLPALGEELLSTEGALPSAVVEALRPLTERQRSQLPLSITGRVFHSGGEQFDVDEASWLSPTPGRPWQFR